MSYRQRTPHAEAAPPHARTFLIFSSPPPLWVLAVKETWRIKRISRLWTQTRTFDPRAQSADATGSSLVLIRHVIQSSLSAFPTPGYATYTVGLRGPITLVIDTF
ncbi:hypothetical protein Nepgr_007302 [Nepenthes gracilis]|uniref:Uncharacterized protein n=1 Tax=Nepenthes gracilis TaxID=150966 RepID=A0AAD3S7I8_NEPGR|nr:hypothetical protein Nepgr_007302 [Nepenthes gracilis]